MTFFSKDFHKVSIENMAIAAREVFEKEITEMSYDFKSAVAAPKEEASTTNNVEDKITSLSPVMSLLANKDSERQRKWFDSGVRAKKNNYGDLSPFYENKTADYFFKCGYAGTSFEQAQEALTEKIKELFNQDCTVFETVNNLQTKVNNAG